MSHVSLNSKQDVQIEFEWTSLDSVRKMRQSATRKKFIDLTKNDKMVTIQKY